jgi:polysaccharide export outer membrane protein
MRAAAALGGKAPFAGIALVLAGNLLACADPPPSKYATQQVHVGDASLGPGDVFEVRVYRQDSMSGAYNVSPEGTISFPLIGVVVVSDKTPRQVEAEIESRLAEGFLVNPQVSVLMKEYRSRNVIVFGQVQKPGRLPFSTGMTIVEAISQAGGFSAMARKNAVTVTRTDGDKKTNFTVPVESIGNGQAPDFMLRPADIVFVPERLF